MSTISLVVFISFIVGWAASAGHRYRRFIQENRTRQDRIIREALGR